MFIPNSKAVSNSALPMAKYVKVHLDDLVRF